MDDYYEILSKDEADFLIELYEQIRVRVINRENVTLVGIAKNMKVRPSELADYMPEILSMLTSLENEIRQGADRD
jgi:hypothetical protein